jgi:hypothetical protein
MKRRKRRSGKDERQENANERLFVEFRPNYLVDLVHDFERIFNCSPITRAVAFRFALYKRQENNLIASLARDDFQHHR